MRILLDYNERMKSFLLVLFAAMVMPFFLSSEGFAQGNFSELDNEIVEYRNRTRIDLDESVIEGGLPEFNEQLEIIVGPKGRRSNQLKIRKNYLKEFREESRYVR